MLNQIDAYIGLFSCDLLLCHLLNPLNLAYRSGMSIETEYLNFDTIGQSGSRTGSRTSSRTGQITLNRPKALHALTTTMCHQIRDKLEQYWHDDTIDQVILCASEGRAFCAGGDIREALESMQRKSPETLDYFEAEYAMDMIIAGFPKPLICIADGLTMGGGSGLLFNSSHPVITDRIDFTMPETGIGLFPDVAASLFLRRATGRIGLFIGLTGTRIGHGDMVASGLMDYFIPHEMITELKAAIAALAPIAARPEQENIDDLLSAFARRDAEPMLLMPHLDWINDILAHDRLEAIRDAAAASDHSLAAPLYQALTQRCPLSLKVTHRLLTSAPSDGYISALLLDYCLAKRITEYPDFAEGVRAAVIDKDQNPQWSYQCLEDVTDEMIDDIFDDSNRPHFALPSVLL